MRGKDVMRRQNYRRARSGVEYCERPLFMNLKLGINGSLQRIGEAGCWHWTLSVPCGEDEELRDLGNSVLGGDVRIGSRCLENYHEPRSFSKRSLGEYAV